LADVLPTDPSIWPALAGSLAPIIVGGAATHFKLFLDSKGDFRGRVRLHKKGLIEKLATKHATMLQHVRSLAEDDELRGDGRETPDLVGDLAADTFHLFAVFFRCEILSLVLKVAYHVMFATIVLGIAGLIIAWLVAESRPYILVGAIVVLIVQVSSIFGAFRASWKLDEIEDVT